MCPDQRQHRGAHPADRQLFAPEKLEELCNANTDLAWLLSRRYAMNSSLKLVGDRFTLTERQRTALSRICCSDEARDLRARSRLAWEDMRGEEIAIDGFNLLITIEAALGGGLILHCRDSCLRDLASMHGSYRSVEETDNALQLIGHALERVEPKSVLWLLDSPVSNSGRLAQSLRDMAKRYNWPWEVNTVFNPDSELKASRQIIITSDSVILDNVARWVNAAAYLISSQIPQAWIVDFVERV